ncbi:MAG: DUF5916 domain-containing protein [Adhaeribacter sp.]
MKSLLPGLIFCLLSLSLLGQKKNAAFSLPMRQATSVITVDGLETDPAWQQAIPAKDFFMMFPMDTSAARVKTEVRMTYDQDNIYILAVNHHLLPGPYMVESLRRDFSFGKNDNFIFFLDPFDDQTNGFSFGANAAGAQWDGIMYEGGKVDLSWDNKWTSVVRNEADRWVFEAAIPFKSIRYKKGITNWGVNFSRLDLKAAEKSAWAPVPRQFPSAALAYTGTLAWDQAPPEAGTNISLIPYVLGGMSKDYVAGKPRDYRHEAGLDAKVAVTSSMNLDLTVNPDFSQVEVDQQVTNLDRFELFFPERRQFFLENGDLFTNYGYTNLRPFFSRRIGLDAPIHFGARLSGKINKDWRLGVLDMQTGKVEERGLPAQNFAVVSLQRRVFARSTLGLLLVNKETMDFKGRDPGLPGPPLPFERFNRNLGLEYNLASVNNMWTGKALVLKSFRPENKGHDLAQAANLQYASRAWLISWQHQYVGRNYRAEVGYVPRVGYIQVSPKVGRLFFAKSGPVLSHGPTLSTTHLTDESLKSTDNTTVLAYAFGFRNQSTFTAWAASDYVRLLQPFDPTNFRRDTLARGTEHRWQSWGTDFVSKPNSTFTYAFSTRYGGYYAGGTRLNLTATMGYRFQPYVSVALNSSYNHIKLPQPWGRTQFWLLGPRLDVTMTNKLYLTTFVQYNEQLKNINLNARLQWRYQPASDLFLVYTDNYLPENLFVKSRALVLKFTYWWNL